MHTGPTPALAKELTGVQQEFETWRRTHRPRATLPAPLWAAAAAVAREAGLNVTARRLRLNYYALKRHMEGTGRAARPAASGPPAFVELTPPRPWPPGAPECVIELADGQGATLRITLPSPALPDVVALTQALWRRPA
jgi:hypothetical protein